MSHFLDLANLQGDALRQMLDAGAARKAARAGLPKGRLMRMRLWRVMFWR
jgi:hypothetical protein